MLNIEGELFKILDGSHMEISFVAQSDMDEDAEPFDIVLMLDYRVYDIRPKQFAFKEIGKLENKIVCFINVFQLLLL